MSAEKFATRAPARLEWHPAHGDLARGDPETFLLHIEFVHAHGLPKGEFTTLSLAPVVGGADRAAEDGGARGE